MPMPDLACPAPRSSIRRGSIGNDRWTKNGVFKNNANKRDDGFGSTADTMGAIPHSKEDR